MKNKKLVLPIAIASLIFTTLSFAEVKNEKSFEQPSFCFFGYCFMTSRNGGGWRPPKGTGE